MTLCHLVLVPERPAGTMLNMTCPGLHYKEVLVNTTPQAHVLTPPNCLVKRSLLMEFSWSQVINSELPPRTKHPHPKCRQLRNLIVTVLGKVDAEVRQGWQLQSKVFFNCDSAFLTEILHFWKLRHQVKQKWKVYIELGVCRAGISCLWGSCGGGMGRKGRLTGDLVEIYKLIK